VYTFFSTCLSNCVASAAWFVFGCVFFLFSFFFPCKFNKCLWNSVFFVRMTLLICLSSFSICMFIILNFCVCVSKHAYAFPSSSICVHIYRQVHKYCLCYVLTYTRVFVYFLLVLNLKRHLCLLIIIRHLCLLRMNPPLRVLPPNFESGRQLKGGKQIEIKKRIPQPATGVTREQDWSFI